MRKYQEVWELVKKCNDTKEKCVALTAHPAHHRRIKKAIRKEKHLDMAYALELSEAGLVARLDMESEKSKITIRLHVKDDITFI